MFFQLFSKECSQILKSIVYYIFLLCLGVFFFTQLSGFKVISEPKPGQKSYDEFGHAYSKDERKIMKATLGMLAGEYMENKYVTYPIGFYKQVILNEKKQGRIGEILSEASGLTVERLNETLQKNKESQQNAIIEEGGYQTVYGKSQIELEPAASFEYEEFLMLMSEVNDLLGGGSDYNEKTVPFNVIEQLTYESALEEYNNIVEKDKVSRAYARLFCDYLGIMLAILPVFLGVARQLRDKRAQVDEIIYVHKMSSAGIVLSRYAATLVMVLLPVFILAISPSLQCIYLGNSLGAAVDVLAYPKYILGWLLPTIMVVTGVGFCVTELTNGPLAILIQGIWWFLSINGVHGSLVGKFGMNLIPRFNSVGKSELYQSIVSELVINRIFYTILSIVLVGITIWIYDLKRKGRMINGGSLFKNKLRQSKA